MAMKCPKCDEKIKEGDHVVEITWGIAEYERGLLNVDRSDEITIIHEDCL